MTTPPRCPQCDTQLPGGRWGGLCPRCLARVSLLPTQRRRVSETRAAEAPDPVPVSDASVTHSSPPHRIGDYELREEIARGGMAVVWRARQSSLGRMVALKLLRGAEFAGAESRERFRKEAAAVASMQHPNIVALYDFGEQDGQPWISMALIEGTTLADLVREQPLLPARAAAMLRTIAGAIAYAHRRGILHRDLKPSNILLDQSGQPHVTDFGLAKRFDLLSSVAQEGDLTVSGQFLGTPHYAPPEQLAMHRGQVGPHSDVYALGAILYETLTGRPPFLAASIEATLLQVIDLEPVSPRLLNPAVPVDLQTICAKCLEKETARRYATALELQEELGRFLAGEPIHARPLGTAGQLWRWCRRKPGWATAGALALLSVAAVVAVTAVARIRLAERAGIVRQNSYVADMRLVAQAIDANNLAHATELLEKWRIDSTPRNDLCGFEWYHYAQRCRSDELLTVGTHAHVVTSLAFSPDGRQVASGDFDGEVRIWDVSSEGEPNPVPESRGMARHSVRAGPERPARGGSHHPGQPMVPPAPRLLGVVRHASRVNTLAFSPDGHLLASGSADDSVQLWNRATLEPLGIPLAHAVDIMALAFSSDSDRLAVVTLTEFVLWNLETREIISRQPIPGWQRAAISADWKAVALGQPDGSVTLWDVAGRSQSARLAGHDGMVLPVVFSGDGRWLAAGGFDNTASVWDVASRLLVHRLTNHVATVSALAFSPDTMRLASVSHDQTIKLWETSTGKEIASLHGHRGAIWSLAFSADGSRVATGGKDGTVRLWPVRPKPVETNSWRFSSENMPAGMIGLSQDGAEIVALHGDGKVTWRRLDAWDQPVVVAERSQRFLGLASVPEGVVLLNPDGKIEIRSKAGRGPIAELTGDFKSSDDLVLSNRGRFLARIELPGIGLSLLETASGSEIARFGHSPHHPWLVPAFSPDDRVLVVAQHTGGIFLWDVGLRREIGWLRGHTLRVDGLRFSRDGKRLASASEDGTVRLWDVATQREIAALRAGADAFWSVVISPDERRIAAGTGDGRVILWEWTSRQMVAHFRVQSGGIIGVAFSPDGQSMIGVGPQTIARWHAPRLPEADRKPWSNP